MEKLSKPRNERFTTTTRRYLVVVVVVGGKSAKSFIILGKHLIQISYIVAFIITLYSFLFYFFYIFSSPNDDNNY